MLTFLTHMENVSQRNDEREAGRPAECPDVAKTIAVINIKVCTVILLIEVYHLISFSVP